MLISEDSEERFRTWESFQAQIFHGQDLCCLMIKRSNGRRQRRLSVRILSCVWERCRLTRKQMKDGKVKLQMFNYPIRNNKCWELIVNQLSSSGIFLRTYFIADSSKGPGRFSKTEFWKINVWRSYRLHVHVQRHRLDSEGKRREISNSEKAKLYAQRVSQGHRTFFGLGDETKLYVNRNYTPEGKWDSMATQIVQRFRGTGHPVFARASALSRGILRRLQGKETTHFNADSSNTELLFQIIHSANQLSMYGAVSHWSELFDQQENLVLTEKYLQTKTRWKQWARRYRRPWIHMKWTLSWVLQGTNKNLETDCEKLWRTSNQDPKSTRLQKIGDCIILGSGCIWTIVPNTYQDVVNGFWGYTPACREYIHPRNDPRSKVFTAILGGTNIGPVVQVRVAFLLNNQGIEMEIPAPRRPKMKSWVVICRGRNRFVNELHVHETVCHNTRSELLGEEDIVKRHEQPRDRIRSHQALRELVRNLHGPLILRHSFPKVEFTLKQRKWISITACPEFKKKGRHSPQMSRHTSWDWYIITNKKSENLTERFTGTIYFRTWRMHLGMKFSDKDWRPKFKALYIVSSCNSRSYRWTHGNTRIDGSRWNSVQLERTCLSQKMLCQHQSHPQDKSRRWRERKQRGKTNLLLHTTQPFRWKSRWRRTRRWHIKTEESSLLQQLETQPRCCILGQIFRAQDQWLQFWQTRSNAIIVHDLAPANYIYRAIFPNGNRILLERPPPRMTPTDEWQTQQQSQFNKEIFSVHQASGNRWVTLNHLV